MKINSINRFEYIPRTVKNEDNKRNPDYAERKSSACGFAEQKNELPSFFYMPVSFSAKKKREYYTSKKNFAEIPGKFIIAKYKNVPCPACGKLMFTQKQFDKFKKKIDKASPDEYIDILSDYTEYMRDAELNAYKDIVRISAQTGEKDLRKIVERLRNTKLVFLQQRQTYLANRMLDLAITLPEDERRVLSEKVHGLKKIIKKNRGETPFRRKILINKISKIRISDKEKQKKLRSIAKSFPSSSDTDSAWIVKYSGLNKQQEPWNSHDIAIRLLEFSVPNTDHIRPYSKARGNDDITNYMAMHKGCNNHKSDSDFLDWFNEDPVLREESMRKYFEKADEIISSKKIIKSKYKKYVPLATETVKKASKGKANIKIKSAKSGKKHHK